MAVFQIKPRPAMATLVRVLTIWTGKNTARLLYDSTVDEFTADGFFEKVRCKPNIAVVGFTSRDDVFGAFHSVAVAERDREVKDPTVFVFSFESHGRCATPKMFTLNPVVKWKEAVCLCTGGRDGSHGFLKVSNPQAGCEVFLGTPKHQTCCHDTRKCFEGLDDTTLTRSVFYRCTRVLAVQMD